MQKTWATVSSVPNLAEVRCSETKCQALHQPCGCRRRVGRGRFASRARHVCKDRVVLKGTAADEGVQGLDVIGERSLVPYTPSLVEGHFDSSPESSVELDSVACRSEDVMGVRRELPEPMFSEPQIQDQSNVASSGFAL